MIVIVEVIVWEETAVQIPIEVVAEEEDEDDTEQ